MTSIRITVLMILIAAAAVCAAQVAITIQPPRPIIAKTAFGQEINFDFRVDNKETATLTLQKVEMRVLDRNDLLEYARSIDSGGFGPAILTIPARDLKSGQGILIFNPFHTLPSYLDIASLRYRFHFAASHQGSSEVTVDVTIQPRNDVPRTVLSIPLDGLVWVRSGHDFISHHRRFDYLIARQFGFPESNFMRYSWDMFLVDVNGNSCRASCRQLTDYYGYGTPVLAPADGTVVEIDDSFPDDLGGEKLSPAGIKQNLHLFHGNYVVIKHAEKEFTLLAHLRPKSIQVKRGDQVKAGQRIGEIGCSGSAEEPHLHWEFRDSPDFSAEGLPGYFHSFDRVIGSKKIRETLGPIDSGDLVERAR